MKEHAWEDTYKEDEPATCTKAGKASIHCKDCGISDENSITILKQLDHTWGELVEITPATCGVNQEVGKKCSICGEVDNDSIKVIQNTAKEHNYIDTVVAPTCIEAGYTEHKCTNCGETSKINKVKALGHNYVDTIVAPTCTNVGYTEHKCTNCGETSKINEVKALGHKLTTTTTKATNKKDGAIVTSCNVCGKVEKTEKIAKIKTVSLSKTSYTYDAKAKKPSVTIKDANGKKISNKNYKVTYKNNKNIGKATVTIVFSGNYSGTITKTFKIVPTKVKGTKVKKTSKTTATLSWKKVSGNVTGYKVYVWNNSKKAYVYYGKVKGKTSMTIKSLKGKTTYKFKVKAYKTISGTQYTGARSDAFKGKTK